jgi:hypothetical protein
MSLLPLLGPRPFGPFAPGAADRGRREGLGRNAPLRGCEKRMVPGMTRGRPRGGLRGPRCARSHPCIVCSKRGQTGQSANPRSATRPRFRAFIQGASRVRLFGWPIDRSLGTFASGRLTRSARKRDAHIRISVRSRRLAVVADRPWTGQLGGHRTYKSRRERKVSALLCDDCSSLSV